jgi:hypothetical protein
VYGVIAVVSLLALTSTVVAFRKGTTREIVRVVESYSAYLRRKDAPPSLLNRRKLRSTAAKVDADSATSPAAAPAAKRSAERRPAKLPDSAANADGGWLLSGLGKEKTFRIEIASADLQAAGTGSEGGLVLGRSSTLCDRVVDDSTVSRRHAKLFLADGVLMIEDMGSAYGTKVNGKPVPANQAERIDTGDRLAIGGVKFEIARA